MTGTKAALAVVALLLLAGCSGFGGLGTTREPLDVDPVETTTAEPDDRPPVIAFDPVQDTAPSPFDIVEAHEDVLTGRSYAVDLHRTQTYANGTRIYVEDRTTTFGANRSRYVHRSVASLRNSSIERRLYANGTHAWSWTSRNGGPASVSLLETAQGEPAPPSTTIAQDPSAVVLSGLVAGEVTDVEALDTVPSGVDDPVFRVVLNRTKTEDPYGDETLNSTITLIVTEEGRIVEYYHRYAYVRNGATVHAEVRVQYLSVDVATVDRPDWVPTNGTTDGTTTRAVFEPTTERASTAASRAPDPTAEAPSTPLPAGPQPVSSPSPYGAPCRVARAGSSSP